jgi:hypothetical protein
MGLSYPTIIVFLDIIRRPVLYLKHTTFRRLDSPEIETSSIDCAQLSKFLLKRETESSLRNVVCFK